MDLLQALYCTYQGPNPLNCAAVASDFWRHCTVGTSSWYLLSLEHDVDTMSQNIKPFGRTMFSGDISESNNCFLKHGHNKHSNRGGGVGWRGWTRCRVVSGWPSTGKGQGQSHPPPPLQAPCLQDKGRNPYGIVPGVGDTRYVPCAEGGNGGTVNQVTVFGDWDEELDPQVWWVVSQGSNGEGGGGQKGKKGKKRKQEKEEGTFRVPGGLLFCTREEVEAQLREALGAGDEGDNGDDGDDEGDEGDDKGEWGEKGGEVRGVKGVE